MLVAKKLLPFGKGIDVLKYFSVFSGPKFSLQHRDRIHNPAGAIPKGGRDYGCAAPAVKGAQGLQPSACDGNNAIGAPPRPNGPAFQFAENCGMQQRHIASNHQVPLRDEIRLESRFHSGKWPATFGPIRQNGKAQMVIQSGLTYQANCLHNLRQFLRDMTGQKASLKRQQRFIRAHSEALAPHQNEARKAYSPTHQEMISLQYVTRRQRFAPCSLFLLVSAVSFGATLRAEPLATRKTLVVRTDARTGRLVRSVLVSPRLVLVKASLAQTTAQTTDVPQSVASGSLSDMIDAIAERNQVEAPLVHSVIKAESNYNPAAISPKGAQGLMQLIPSTAHRFGVSNSFDVQQNVEGGVKYLKFLIDLYNNDYPKVIAAYNAGEGAVAKYRGIPPYSETINYVYRVGRNLKAARQFAELKAAERKATPQPVQTAAVKSENEPHSIQAVTGDDGRIYYKTQ